MVKVETKEDSFDKYADHITQSWVWGEFRSKTPSIKKVLRLSAGKKVWQIFFSRVPKTNFTVAYLPRVTPPTVEELEELKKYCKAEKALFLKIEPLEEACYGLPSKSILPRHTIYLDLKKTENELLKEMHEKTRYNIRLAEKKHVVVKEESTSEDLDRFIALLESTENRQGFYSHYPEYYRQMWSTLRPKNMVYLLNAYVDGKHAAGLILFHFKNMLYYPYGASNPEFREYMAPNLLHWHAIKFGKKLGCTSYDLWGSYKNTPTDKDPWWGIYRFKKGFGGSEITFPKSIDIPLSPLYRPLVLAERIHWKILKLKK